MRNLKSEISNKGKPYKKRGQKCYLASARCSIAGFDNLHIHKGLGYNNAGNGNPPFCIYLNLLPAREILAEGQVPAGFKAKAVCESYSIRSDIRQPCSGNHNLCLYRGTPDDDEYYTYLYQ